MPEMPEVAAIAAALDERLRGHSIAAGHLVSFSALKTFKIPLDALAGLEVDGVGRHGKFIDIDAQGVHLIFHLARGGWVTWHDVAPKVPARPGRSGLALRIVLDDDSGFSLTEAGTQKHLAVYVVDDPQEVPGIAALGPDPMDPSFTVNDFRGVLKQAGKAQLKGVLRDQKRLAGIGNAGHPCIRNISHGSTGLHVLNQLSRAHCFVVLMQTDERFADFVMPEQLLGMPGVLAGDEVR